jgi:hypothetical protein
MERQTLQEHGTCDYHSVAFNFPGARAIQTSPPTPQLAEHRRVVFASYPFPERSWLSFLQRIKVMFLYSK